MRIYYAHCMAIYGTPQEDRDMALLERIFPGEAVINPNTPMISKQCDAMRAEIEIYNVHTPTCPGGMKCMGYAPHTHPRDASGEIMTRIFQPLAKGCDLLVFRALPDGMIPSGVLKEIQWADEARIPVLELPSAMMRRELSVAATKQYLKEIGQR